MSRVHMRHVQITTLNALCAKEKDTQGTHAPNFLNAFAIFSAKPELVLEDAAVRS